MLDDVPELQSSHAILVAGGKYLLQLRDDVPGIPNPGQWCLFGGRRNEDESPERAMVREIMEELALAPSFTFLGRKDYFHPFWGKVIRTWFFRGDVTDIWHRHRLSEGQGWSAFDYSELSALNLPVAMREAMEEYEGPKSLFAGSRRKEISG